MSDTQFQVSETKVDKGQLVALGAGVAAASVLALEAPSFAAAGDGVTEITGVATAVAGVAVLCLVVAMAPLTIHYALKIGKRVMNS